MLKCPLRATSCADNKIKWHDICVSNIGLGYKDKTLGAPVLIRDIVDNGHQK